MTPFERECVELRRKFRGAACVTLGMMAEKYEAMHAERLVAQGHWQLNERAFDHQGQWRIITRDSGGAPFLDGEPVDEESVGRTWQSLDPAPKRTEITETFHVVKLPGGDYADFDSTASYAAVGSPSEATRVEPVKPGTTRPPPWVWIPGAQLVRVDATYTVWEDDDA